MLAIGVTLIVVGFAGTFFGNLIKSAVSRQREFLADASSVQFTRSPAGIANALKKIGGYHAGSHMDDSQARTAFDAAALSLPFKGLELLPRDAVSTAALEPAVIHLCNVPPSDKRPLMQALARAVEHDGFITVTQAELLRAIADSLDCPLPPLLADADPQQNKP